MGSNFLFRPAAGVWRVCQPRTLPVSRFSGPLDVGKTSGGGLGCGKVLTPLLGRPSASVCGVLKQRSGRMGFRCCRCRLGRSLAKPSGLVACRVLGVLPNPAVPLSKRLPFPTARPFGWLCLRGGFLVDALGFPSLWMPSFVFSVAASSRLVLGCR